MTSKTQHRARKRTWFDTPLTVLGTMFLLFGTAFFVFVASIGAPVVPFGGLAIAMLGLWLVVIRPRRRARSTPHSGAPD